MTTERAVRRTRAREFTSRSRTWCPMPMTFPSGPSQREHRRVAILRAMRSFVRKHGAYTLAGGKGTTRIDRLDKPAMPRWLGHWSDQ